MTGFYIKYNAGLKWVKLFPHLSKFWTILPSAKTLWRRSTLEWVSINCFVSFQFFTLTLWCVVVTKRPHMFELNSMKIFRSFEINYKDAWFNGRRKSWGIHKKLRSCKTMIPACIAIYFPFTINFPINSLSVNLTKWSNTLKHLSAKADELLGCVWPLCGVGA